MEAAVRPVARPRASDKLERIFVDHHEQVFRAAYRITGNATDAEDVLQTVFLRIARLDRGDALSEAPGSYLHRAAVNVALDLVRDRKSSRIASIEDVAFRLNADDRDDPERRAEGARLRRRLREAVARLGPRMAEVFALRYFEGYDNREIARMLGTSRGTVAVLLHRARARLKKDLTGIRGDRP